MSAELKVSKKLNEMVIREIAALGKVAQCSSGSI